MKYQVKLDLELKNVSLSEFYEVEASSPEEAERIVSGGGGTYLEEEITNYGTVLNESVTEVVSVK